MPFKVGAAVWKNGQIVFNKQHFKAWDSYGLADFKFRSGSFNEDARGRWYFNVVVEVERQLSPGQADVGIDLGLKTTATCSDAKTNMAKSVLDAGWGQLKSMLEYKCDYAGIVFKVVSEINTTQTCSSCKQLPASRPRGIAGLGIREWTCCGCGVTHDRDVNAAKNILCLHSQTIQAVTEESLGHERPIVGIPH